MSESKAKPLTDFDRDYAQEDLRFQVIGMIGLLLQDRKRKSESSQRAIAERLGVDKSQVSRWLSGDHNLTLKTVAEIVEALDGSIEFAIRDRHSDRLYHQAGIQEPHTKKRGLPTITARPVWTIRAGTTDTFDGIVVCTSFNHQVPSLYDRHLPASEPHAVIARQNQIKLIASVETQP